MASSVSAATSISEESLCISLISLLNGLPCPSSSFLSDDTGAIRWNDRGAPPRLRHCSPALLELSPLVAEAEAAEQSVRMVEPMPASARKISGALSEILLIATKLVRIRTFAAHAHARTHSATQGTAKRGSMSSSFSSAPFRLSEPYQALAVCIEQRILSGVAERLDALVQRRKNDVRSPFTLIALHECAHHMHPAIDFIYCTLVQLRRPAAGGADAARNDEWRWKRSEPWQLAPACDLLDRLYSSLHSFVSLSWLPLCHLSLSLLLAAFAPFLQWIQAFINGLPHSALSAAAHAEFFVEVDDDITIAHADYWNKSARIRGHCEGGEDAVHVPLFLKELAEEVVICGKIRPILFRMESEVQHSGNDDEDEQDEEEGRNEDEQESPDNEIFEEEDELNDGSGEGVDDGANADGTGAEKTTIAMLDDLPLTQLFTDGLRTLLTQKSSLAPIVSAATAAAAAAPSDVVAAPGLLFLTNEVSSAGKSQLEPLHGMIREVEHAVQENFFQPRAAPSVPGEPHTQDFFMTTDSASPFDALLDSYFRSLAASPHMLGSLLGSLAPASASSSVAAAPPNLLLVFHSLFRVCLFQPIRSHFQRCSRRFLFLLINRAKLFECFSAFRELFFMANGSFSQKLCAQLWAAMDRTKKPEEEEREESEEGRQEGQRQRQEADGGMQWREANAPESDEEVELVAEKVSGIFVNLIRSEIASKTIQTIFQDKLTVTIKHDSSAAGRRLSPSTDPLHFLSCLDFHINLKWPLNLFIDSTALQIYSAVFRFLLQLRRAEYSLHTIASTTLKERSPALYSAALHRFCLLRTNISHFVRHVSDCFLLQILHYHWNDFVKQMRCLTADLSHFASAHLHYLRAIQTDAIMSAAMAPAADALRNILQCAVFLETRCKRKLEERMESSAKNMLEKREKNKNRKKNGSNEDAGRENADGTRNVEKRRLSKKEQIIQQAEARYGITRKHHRMPSAFNGAPSPSAAQLHSPSPSPSPSSLAASIALQPSASPSRGSLFLASSLSQSLSHSPYLDANVAQTVESLSSHLLHHYDDELLRSVVAIEKSFERYMKFLLLILHAQTEKGTQLYLAALYNRINFNDFYTKQVEAEHDNAQEQLQRRTEGGKHRQEEKQPESRKQAQPDKRRSSLVSNQQRFR